MGEPDRRELRRLLLAWYRAQKRDLPFRRTRDPYAILVAEVLLQRTRVKAGLPYYERFLAAFPTVRDLAAASESDVLRAWEGLGFYRRARNFHRAAKAIVEMHGGEVPGNFAALLALPGVGDYTASAVGSIAFGLRVPAVDGNVTRVLSRVYVVEDDVSQGEGRHGLHTLATELVPAQGPGEWNQAVMELGATVCVPRAPKCPSCPISSECMAFAAGTQDRFPMLAVKRRAPVVPVVFAVSVRGGRVLLQRRERGLHEGMYGLPGGERGRGEDEDDAVRRHLAAVGIRATSIEPLAPVRHSFSHRTWRGTAFTCDARGVPIGAEWFPLKRLARLPLVPLHRQLINQARHPPKP